MMSGDAQSASETAHAELDGKIARVRDKAREFARLGVREKRALLDECRSGVVAVSEDWVRAACRAKGLDFAGPSSGEEWLAGPSVTVRNLRLLSESLVEIEARGKPRTGVALRTRPDGRVEVDVFP